MFHFTHTERPINYDPNVA